jgi:hypothetical protein
LTLTKRIFSSDSTGVSCLIEIYKNGKGLLKISGNGWVDQHIGDYKFDSLQSSWSFIPYQTISSDLCKSFYWKKPILTIGKSPDVQHRVAEINNAHINMSIPLSDSINAINFTSKFKKTNEEIRVTISYPSNPMLKSENWEFNYLTTGICSDNNRFFDKIKIELFSDHILIYDLNEHVGIYPDEIKYFNIID